MLAQQVICNPRVDFPHCRKSLVRFLKIPDLLTFNVSDPTTLVVLNNLCHYREIQRPRVDIALYLHQPPTAQRAQKPPSTSNFARNAMMTTQPIDSGRNTFQPIRISWS